MDRVQEKISYLNGLAEGLELYLDKKEGKFYQEVVNILSDLNESLIHTTNRLSELEEYVEAIDEDLNDIEWDYYEDDEDMDYDDELYDFEDEDEFIMDGDEDAQYFQVICPSCHETVMVDQDLFENSSLEEVVCPNCQEVLVIDTDGQPMGEGNPQFQG